MPNCHQIDRNCQGTVTHFCSILALDTVFLTKVYWSYSTRIYRVCFTPLLESTLQRDLKRKRNFQINFNSLAMARLYELLCYHSFEQLDPMLDEFVIFIHTTLSSLYFFPATSTVLPETTNDTSNGS